MHDFFIHRRAQHARVIVVPFERRLGSEFLDLGLGRALQIHRRNPGLDQRLQVIEHLPDDVTAAPHLFDLTDGLADYRHASFSRAQ